MLILKRWKEESVVIGSGENAVRIMVTEITKDWVKLGIEAPKSIPVHRAELYADMVRQGGESGVPSLADKEGRD